MTSPGYRGAAPWTVLSATGAVLLLIGGWLVAGALQPATYDPVRDTISKLAAAGASDRWLMTLAFVGIGLCHLTTASGARAVRPAGRVTLALGGLGTLAVAAFPLPAVGGRALHTAAASVAFASLALWPVLGVQRRGPLVLRAPLALPAAVVMLALLLWFVAGSPAEAGLSERLATAAQALWPLAVVLALRRSGSPLPPGDRDAPPGVRPPPDDEQAEPGLGDDAPGTSVSPA